ncbi:EcsC family protein [Bacillus sp. EAC]|uniref:EcsC family protein n=1 Tax=Bacillus sp. EAC TaxID=1978338 RepID=UPI000B42E4B1|nr:EcsC family protein [Bacillus sp. EAC]
MENKEYLMNQLKVIEKWEKDQKNVFFWEKIGRIPFMILDKITPKFIHEKIGLVLDELSKYVNVGGQYLVSVPSTLSKINKELGIQEITDIEKVSELTIEQMDHISNYFIASRKQFAKVQGATTGFGGIFTLAIDVPILLGLTLKTLQEIAISHGYDPNDQEERVFIIKCLQFTSSDIVGKKAILEELTNIEGKKAFSQIEGWREVFYTYRDNMGWKKLFQMVPIAGLIFGAYVNKQAIEDVGGVGRMLYKKRRVIEKLNHVT